MRAEIHKPVDARGDRVVSLPQAHTPPMDRLLELSRDRGDRENEWLARARAGDRAAFERVVRERFAGVYALLFRLAGNHEDAEDLAQECFVRAWRSLPSLREGEAFAPWLQRIALHLARDHHRVRVRRGRPEELSSETLGRAPVPGDELSGRETMHRLRDALERLPHRLRAALTLRVLEGLDYEQVAEATGVRPATARTHVMQARRLLSRWMAPWLPPSKEGRGK